jgi:hypothetical protein
MKSVCLHVDLKRRESMPEYARNAPADDRAHDDALGQGGHFYGGEALGSTRDATTLRYRSGKVSVTDGPYAETKE